MIKILQWIVDLPQPVYPVKPTLTPSNEIGVEMMANDHPLRKQYERMARHQALIEVERQATTTF